jgi:hypothetical protein
VLGEWKERSARFEAMRSISSMIGEGEQRLLGHGVERVRRRQRFDANLSLTAT